MAAAKPKVLFVLGGPGAGKGTQCAKIIENYKQWAHISAGDCLRAERSNPKSKEGELINSLIKEGKIVPSEITVGLLEKAMKEQQQKQGKTSFLIDGFPRSLGNVNSWEGVIGDRADVSGVLFYDANQEEMEKRLLGRGETSGRVDDNIESIRKRFTTYLEETMPIVKKYEEKGLVFTIDAMPPPEEVWAVTRATLAKIEGSKPKVLFDPPPPVGTRARHDGSTAHMDRSVLEADLAHVLALVGDANEHSRLCVDLIKTLPKESSVSRPVVASRPARARLHYSLKGVVVKTVTALKQFKSINEKLQRQTTSKSMPQKVASAGLSAQGFEEVAKKAVTLLPKFEMIDQNTHILISQGGDGTEKARQQQQQQGEEQQGVVGEEVAEFKTMLEGLTRRFGHIIDLEVAQREGDA